MNKAEALKILIERSPVLPKQSKQQLLQQLPNFSDKECDRLGRFLALTMQHGIEDNKQLLAELDQVIVALDENKERNS